MNDLDKTGVYQILNTVNGKRYIGSAAKSFRQRWKLHLNKLRRGMHPNKHLQSAWAIYSESSFAFSILLICEPERCLSEEQSVIDSLRATNNKYGYNLAPIAGSVRGFKHSKESRKANSERAKTRNSTEHAKSKMSE